MKKTVGLVENIRVIGKKTKKCQAKFDTGAYRTSIDQSLTKELGIKKTGKKVRTKSSFSIGGIKRPIVEITVEILGKRIKTTANISNRSHSKQKILIGRNIIFGNFIVDVEKNNKSPRTDDLK